VFLYIVEHVLKRNQPDVLPSEVMFIMSKDSYTQRAMKNKTIYFNIDICVYSILELVLKRNPLDVLPSEVLFIISKDRDLYRSI